MVAPVQIARAHWAAQEDRREGELGPVLGREQEIREELRGPDEPRGERVRDWPAPGRMTTFAALSVWDASRESDALVKRWPGTAEAVPS